MATPIERARAKLREREARNGRAEKKKATPGPRPLGGPAALDTATLGDRFMRPITWLVPDFIPLGCLTVIAADGGVGKSVLTLDLAARLSRGECCLGLDYPPAAPCRTLLIQCEDSEECTVLPRLIAAGGDPDFILTLETPSFTLSQIPALAGILDANPSVRLVILDPVSAYIPREVNDHTEAEVRGMLRPLDEMAERYNVAVVLVKHLNKSDSGNARLLISGSIGYVNASRISLLAGDDPDDEERQVLVIAKRNLMKPRRGLAFARVPLCSEDVLRVLSARQASRLSEPQRLALTEQLFRLSWLGETEVSAADLARARRGAPEKKLPPRVAEAADWLRDFLMDSPRNSEEVFAAGEAKGFTKKNLYAAKDQIGFKAKPSTVRGKWVWQLPEGNPFVLPD